LSGRGSADRRTVLAWSARSLRMMEVVKEDVSDDEFDTTVATRTTSNAPASARISFHLRLMPLTAHLEQKN
jgi:hypothetical protein